MISFVFGIARAEMFPILRKDFQRQKKSFGSCGENSPPVHSDSCALTPVEGISPSTSEINLGTTNFEGKSVRNALSIEYPTGYIDLEAQIYPQNVGGPEPIPPRENIMDSDVEKSVFLIQQ